LTATTYSKRCWPHSEQAPTYEIEKMLERDNEAYILYDCKIKNGGRSQNTEFFTIEGNKIKRSRGLLRFCPKKTSLNNDLRILAPHSSHTFRLDATALVYKTINSDQLYENRSLILEIPKVLTAVEPLVNKLGLVRI
jgi:hypothetical protein